MDVLIFGNLNRCLLPPRVLKEDRGRGGWKVEEGSGEAGGAKIGEVLTSRVDAK